MCVVGAGEEGETEAVEECLKPVTAPTAALWPRAACCMYFACIW